MTEELKIFIYNKKGEKVKEYFYSDFVYAFNEILSYNIENEDDQLNLICDFSFPPTNLLWNNELKNWTKKDKKYLNQNIDLLKHFK
jgi:hypothetical protein